MMRMLLLVQIDELGGRRTLQASIHRILQHVIVHRRTRLHLQAMLLLWIVHRLIQHRIRTEMVRLVVHVGHLRRMVIHHRWWRLNRALLMILIADRLLLNCRRINHVGHCCVLPLFLVLQRETALKIRIELFHKNYSHSLLRRQKKRKALYTQKKMEKKKQRRENSKKKWSTHSEVGKRKKKEGETARTSLFCGK